MSVLLGTAWVLLAGNTQTALFNQSLTLDLTPLVAGNGAVVTTTLLSVVGLPVLAGRGAVAVDVTGGATNRLVLVAAAKTTGPSLAIFLAQLLTFSVTLDFARGSAAALVLPYPGDFSPLHIPAEPLSNVGLYAGGLTADRIGASTFVYGFLFGRMRSTAGQALRLFWQLQVVPSSLFAPAPAVLLPASSDSVALWVMVDTIAVPSQQFSFSAFATSDQRIILLGGNSFSPRQPFMWLFDAASLMGETITLWQSVAGGPSPRSDAAIALDLGLRCVCVVL
jgi:hypothetical protein